MNLVDSSAWIEYVANGPNAEAFAGPIAATHKLIVPSIVLHEVYKRLLAQVGEEPANAVVSLMMEGAVVDLDEGLALSAAFVSAEHKLPMANSIILATARQHHAVLWTQDADFEGMEGVEYRPYISS